MDIPLPGMSEARLQHVPVMPDEVLHWLAPRPGGCVVDGTVGGGGHASAIARALGPDGQLIALDRDPDMLALASSRVEGCKVQFVRANYARLGNVLDELGVAAVDGVLLDLGMSSDQLASQGRGFSFHDEGPLDLRFCRGEGDAAHRLLSQCTERELGELFREYGEERFSRRIAYRIVNTRRRGDVMTAQGLADLVWRAVPGSARHGRIHPATRVFQALRIAVNDELGSLNRALQQMPGCLAVGGRLVVISFHSLEDRIVKTALRDQERWEVLTRRPVRPGVPEVQANPRARSARLRAAQRRPTSDAAEASTTA